MITKLVTWLVIPFLISLNCYSQSDLYDILQNPGPEKYFLINDYDNDGDSDILIIAGDSSIAAKTILYENSNGNFYSHYILDTVRLSNCTGEFWDADNDNDLDLILSGTDPKSNASKVYIYKNNNGNYQFIPSPILQVSNGIVKCFDFDNDGFQDILISGYNSEYPSGITKYYKNLGEFQFIQLTKEYRFVLTSIDFGDIDNDGKTDLFAIGLKSNLQPITKVFFYDSSNFNSSDLFKDFLSQGVVKLIKENLSDIKVIISGKDVHDSEFCSIYKLYPDSISEKQKLNNILNNSINLADLDSDGVKEIVLFGESGDSPRTTVYKIINGNYCLVKTNLIDLMEGRVFIISSEGRQWIAVEGKYNRSTKVVKFFQYADIFKGQ